MKKTLMTLLLLSLTLTGCVIEPGGGWGYHHGGEDHGGYQTHGGWGR